MFHIGDKIFYPMHGAGIIEAIEEKEILGEKQLYYVINIPLKSMNVMIPKASAEKLGIRQVVDMTILEDVLSAFLKNDPEPSTNQMQRYRIHSNKIKSGDIFEVAEVIHELSHIGKKRTLGTGDKIMLNQARQILISEMILVKGIPEEQADHLLDQVLN
ncbi:CarD family transcriptional regulator [Ammoniphilus resinae]|uniref:CarD family transcriptional regulator n=1 Tax=Ammoniphilus resinae TaxID=861532 RepID=A0ABS4GWY2_9BACL|nr:CarD family transcriptional regulator [Ammoniphilus resinae]MBP1934375.1 CarD family transcriptional regulator [Ammoniphilus resinae]